MKYLAEYRDPKLARVLLGRIRARASRPRVIMEVCGGQTHTLIRQGIDELLAGSIELIHGPGCPVCVTPIQQIDRAVALAGNPAVILASFGDMLRVPGSRGDLLKARARGGDVRVVYSPLDALELARRNPDREVVFFAVGFETTAPANAMAVWRAKELGVGNFSLLVSHVTVPPAMRAILRAAGNRVEAFLAAGHVCTVMGWEEYLPLALEYRVPIVVTGFEPVDLLEGIFMAVEQLEEGRHEVENQYARSVQKGGNRLARELMDRVFQVVDREWRGIGPIPGSGLSLRENLRAFDAEEKFSLGPIQAREATECRAGEVLQGRLKPTGCPVFGTRCTPESPLGAPMVSSEGACAAYYRSGRRPGQEVDP
ncbi:MAG: hydrogenase formation protein HypD [Longimicrobiales bacterium]|nr:hydrogenase formation protein HypD [Longimicrobiales bacterium]